MDVNDCIYFKIMYDMDPELFCSLNEDCNCADCPCYLSRIDYEGEMADRAYEDYLYGGN